MLQWHTTTDDERKRSESQHAVMVQADARAIGMVTARNPNGGRSFPRTHAAEHTSECVCIMPNGDRYTLRSTRKSKSKVTRADMQKINVMQSRRLMAGDLPAIGDLD